MMQVVTLVASRANKNARLGMATSGCETSLCARHVFVMRNIAQHFSNNHCEVAHARAVSHPPSATENHKRVLHQLAGLKKEPL